MDPDAVLDPVVEVARNSGRMEVRDPASRRRTAVMMSDFARQVAEDICRELPDLWTCAFDDALGADFEPLIVELNPAFSSNLYACDARRLLNAIVAHSETVPKVAPAADFHQRRLVFP